MAASAHFRRRQLQDWQIFEDVPAPAAAAAEAEKAAEAAESASSAWPDPLQAAKPRSAKRGREAAEERGSAPADPALVVLEREADQEAAAVEALAGDALSSLVPPAEEPGLFRVYTDGSCVGNGKAGCFAGIGVFYGPGDPRNVSWVLTKGKASNQNAELQALYLATGEADRMLREGEAERVHIHTDSQYGIHCATTWYANWVRNGWVNSTGRPVAHREWIEPIANRLALWKGRIVLVKIKAHVGLWGNEQADRLARAAAERARAAWLKRRADPEHPDAPHAVVYTDPARRPRIKREFVHTRVELGGRLVDIVDAAALRT
jgi:ribonuclease HI